MDSGPGISLVKSPFQGRLAHRLCSDAINGVRRRGIRRACGAVALGVTICLGNLPSVEAEIVFIFSLQQVNPPAVAVRGGETIVYADLIVSGNFPPLLEVDSFQTTLSWTGGTTPLDIYTVNSAGLPVTDSSYVLANEPGFLFSGPPPIVNASEIFWTREIEISWGGSSPAVPPIITSGVTVARLRFAVAEDVDDALFSFTFGVDSFIGGFPATDGGGTISIVPEPGAFQLYGIGIAAACGNLLRRRAA